MAVMMREVPEALFAGHFRGFVVDDALREVVHFRNELVEVRLPWELRRITGGAVRVPWQPAYP